MPLTESERTAVAYAHFTLEEWKLLARCVFNNKLEVPEEKIVAMLTKFPSAVL
jgi:hypothetical protein